MLFLNVAVDTGYGYGIAKSSLKEVIINNYIREIPIKRDALDAAKSITNLNQDSILMEYNGTYYAIGKLALKHYTQTTREFTINRIGNEKHLIELLACVGLICDDNEYNINLMVALPIRYQDKHDDMVDWLRRDFEFSFFTKDGEIKKKVHIRNVECILQPVAPIFTLNPKDIYKKIISIDIGHGTTDIVFMNEIAIVKDTKARLDAEGMQYCYKLLEELLIDKYTNTPYENSIKQLTENQIETIIEQGNLTLSNNILDVNDVLNKTLIKYIEYLYSIIQREYRAYLSQADIVLINGGIFNNNYFTSKFEFNFINDFNIKFTKHKKPQWSIAYGLFLYMNKYNSHFKNKDIYFNAMNNKDLYIEE